MLKVFSGSCLSLDEIDVVRPVRIIEQPHLLGPGIDFFTEDGRPVRPQPSAHTLHKVFSGSALDLNAMNGCEPVVEQEVDHEAEPSSPSTASTSVSTMLGRLTDENERERAKAAKAKTTVLVVGGSGYVASHVVAKLLDVGYTVRITVAELPDQQQQLELYTIAADASRRLSIHECDLTSAVSLREAVKGCKYIFHCGVSPSASKVRDVVKAHVDSVSALFDAIRTVGKPAVKRVVFTGSASAVFHWQDPTPASGMFDESHWNLRSTAATDPVPFAKISFEREAWRLHKMVGVELVVILPSIMIGPSLTRETSEAMRTICDLASGSPVFPFAPNLYWNFVDVRDVALAHVLAIENAELRDQRIIVSNTLCNLAQIGQLIKRTHPHLHPPTVPAPTLLTLILGPISHVRVKMAFLWRNLGVKKTLDTSKSRIELGLRMTDMETTIRDSVDQMVLQGLLPSPQTAASGQTSRKRIGVWLVVAGGVALIASAIGISRNLRTGNRK
jgi:nucleoside-diphosphate-sugar epimerase